MRALVRYHMCTEQHWLMPLPLCFFGTFCVGLRCWLWRLRGFVSEHLETRCRLLDV